jgi:hypothetical protein
MIFCVEISMGKLFGMDGAKLSHKGQGLGKKRVNKAISESSGQRRPKPGKNKEPGGVILLFTGVRYERRSGSVPNPTPELTPMPRIIANNNFKSK